MTLSALKTDQLDAVLQALTPESARTLIREVERDRLLGGKTIPHEFILRHARAVLGEAAGRGVRVGSPQRYFCVAFEDRLVDEAVPDKQSGRILRSSIGPVWTWLTERLAGEILEPVIEALTRAIIDKDQAEITRLAEQLCTTAGSQIRLALEELVPNTRIYLRTAAGLGGMRVLEDALDMAEALGYARLCATIHARTPAHIPALAHGEAEPFVALLRDLCGDSPAAVTTGLLAIMARLAVKTDILTIAVELMGTRKNAKLASSNAATVIECVLHDMELPAEHAIRDIRERAPVDRILANIAEFYGLAEGFENAIDLDLKGPWGKRLVKIRKRLSHAISAEIASAPRIIKSALFRRAVSPGAPATTTGSTALVWPDQHDIHEAKFQVGLLNGIRHYLGQLPINAEYTRITAEVRLFLESLSEFVVDDVRSTCGETRACAEAYLEATAGILEIMFGDEAGELLRRRGRAAAQADADTAAALG